MKSTSGFTMIELLIVVAMIGIVTMISISFYGDNVRQANRTEGRTALTEGAGTLEKCRALYGSYDHANCVFPDYTTESGFYAITSARAATTFTLRASAAGNQADDVDCATLTLTNTGERDATGVDTSDCW